MKLEGVLYNIRWSRFCLGSSFLIPCLDCEAVRAALLEVLKDKQQLPVAIKLVVEDGVRGLRVWKV